MNRFVPSLLGLLLLSACNSSRQQSAEPETVSPTVQPADPNAIANAGAAPTVPSPSPAPSPGDGWQQTYSGIKYKVLRPGTGRRPSSFNRVKVHYHGTLQNGTVFDSSVQRGQPTTFGLNQVIAGWREGLQLMQEGAKYRFIIPPELAYGHRGSPPKIGPNETLTFDIELLEVLY
ncbi:MAG: FKBP-type peptidyl-prolyl cis-trans isomerase [Verrucomicrobiota bacterium]